MDVTFLNAPIMNHRNDLWFIVRQKGLAYSAHSESEMSAWLDSKADLMIIRNCDMTKREDLRVSVNLPVGASRWMLILVQLLLRHFRFPGRLSLRLRTHVSPRC